MSGNRLMATPATAIYKCLETQARVSVWLYEQTDSRLEGVIKGFDDFMNIVLEDAIEITTSTGELEKLGKLLLKGDNITLISTLELD